MPATLFDLAGIITIDTSDAQSAMDGLVKSLGGVNGTIGSLLPLLTGAAVEFTAVAGAIAAVGKEALDAAIEFDNASDKIRITTGAMGENLGKLEDSFKEVFTSVPTSAAAASEAISFLAGRLHISGLALEDLTKTELELSRITGEELKPQLEATTRLFGDWEIATDKQTESLDFLFKISQKTQIGVTQLSQELVKFGSPLREMGFSFEQAAILIGKFQAEGVELNKALPGLRIALVHMADEGVTNAAEAFQKLTEKVIAARTPLEAVAVASDIFGKKAGPDMAEAIRQGRFSIEELQKTIAESTDTIRGAAQDTDDFAEKWTLLKNKVETALVPLGGIIFDTLTAIVSTFVDKGDEIEKRWIKLWDDLSKDSKDGQKSILQEMLDNENPFFNAGHRLADAIHDGFIDGLNKLGNFNLQRWADEHIKAGPSATGPLGSLAIPDSTIDSWKKTADAVGQYSFQVKEAKKSTDGHTGSLGGHTGAMEKNTAAIEANREALRQANLAADASKFFSQEALNIVEEMAAAMKKLEVPRPVIVSFDALGEELDKLPKAIEEVGNAKANTDRIMADAAPFLKYTQAAEILKDQLRDLAAQLPKSWNTIIDSFVKGNAQLTVKVKGFAADLLGVFDSMPGKWGDALRKGVSEFERWFNTIDSIVKLVQRILGSDSPSGLGGILSNLGGIFKKTSKDIDDAISTITHTEDDFAVQTSQTMQKAATGVESGAGRMVAAFGQIAGAALAFIGAKGAGFVGGAFSGALGGIAAAGGIATALGVALSPLTLGLSAAGGALLGGLIGLFTGGKSAQQKEQERLQLDKLRNEVAQSAQQVVNAAIEGFDKAIQFFEHLDDFTAVRKEKFASFFKALTRLMNYFVELAKVWSKDSLEQAKVFAESVGAVATAVGGALDAFDGLNNFIPVADENINAFAANLQTLIEKIGAVFEAIPKELIKHARKLSENLESISGVIGPLLEGMGKLFEFKPIDDSTLDAFMASLRSVIERMGQLADEMDQGMVKAAARFAERAGVVVSILSDGVNGLKSLADLAPIPAEAFDIFFSGIQTVIAKMTDMASTISTEFLGKAQIFAEKAVTIFGSIKAGVEALSALRDFKGVLSETFEAFFNDFNAAVDMVSAMANRAAEFANVSSIFEQYIATGAASLSHAFEMLSQIMNAAGAFFPGGSPVATAAAASTVGISSVGGMGISSVGPMTASAPIVVHQTVQGTMIRESEAADYILRQLVDLVRSGRVSSTVTNPSTL